MQSFLPICRAAFRKAYGLPVDDGGYHAAFDGVDAATLLGLARKHRVIGLLETGLSISEQLRGTGANLWREAAYGQLHHSSRRIEEAERLFPYLEGRVGPALIIKGPALAQQAWPEPALRSFDDIDVRIPRANYDALLAIMHDLEYQPDVTDDRERYHRWHYGWGIGFKDKRGAIVEFNHRFFPPHYPSRHTFHPRENNLWEFIKLDETHIRSLSPSSHLLYACMHAHWHTWERLSWLVDIGGLLARHSDALEKAESRSRRWHFARKCLHTGVGLAARVFGHGLLRAAIDEDVRPTIEQAHQRLVSGLLNMSPAELRAQHRMLMDQMESIAYESRRMLTPGDGDFKKVKLPSRLGWAYSIVRPFRVILKK